MKFLVVLFLMVLAFLMQSFLMPVVAQAYTSLVTAADFTGIAADVSVAVAGIVSVALIILGASLLMRAFGR